MGRKAIPIETIVCVEHILLDRTDAGRGEYLKIAEIRDLLSELYGIEVSDDTVRSSLRGLTGETLSNPKGLTTSAMTPSFIFVCKDGRTPCSVKRYAAKRL